MDNQIQFSNSTNIKYKKSCKSKNKKRTKKIIKERRKSLKTKYQRQFRLPGLGNVVIGARDDPYHNLSPDYFINEETRESWIRYQLWWEAEKEADFNYRLFMKRQGYETNGYETRLYYWEKWNY